MPPKSLTATVHEEAVNVYENAPIEIYPLDFPVEISYFYGAV